MQKPINLKQAQKLIQDLGLNPQKILGQGGEGWIFEKDKDTVVKVYNDGEEKYLKSLSSFQDYLAKNAHFAFNTPQIYEINNTSDGVFYTTEKRLYGTNLEVLFPTLEEKKQFRVINNYFQAVLDLGKVQFPNFEYGNILDISEKITSDKWTEFLVLKLKQRSVLSKTRMLQEVKNYKEKISWLEEIIEKNIKNREKSLVHGDYYFNNILVNDSLQISAVLDLSQHLVVGDPKMDIAGAISFLGINSNVKEKHFNFLNELAKNKYGNKIQKYINIYTLFYSFYYCYLYRTDPVSHQWIVKNLNNEFLWSNLISRYT